MSKLIRIFIAVVLVSAIVIVAEKNVAWAGTSPEPQQAADAQVSASLALDKHEPGTVKPPPGELTVCEDGVHSAGGVSVLHVKDLAPGYCIVAFLRNHAFAVGQVPDGAGKILAQITFVRIFHHGKLVHELPEEDGQLQLCYAAPPDRTVQMYFFDFYGPQLGQRTGKPSWTPLETDVDGGQACASAQITGAYGLMGK